MASKLLSLEGKIPKQPELQVVSAERSDLFGRGSFERWNPDILAARKGGLRIYSKMMDDEQVKAVVDFKRSAVTGRGWAFEYDASVDLAPEEQKLRIGVLTAMIQQQRGAFVDSMRAILRGDIYGYSITEKVTGSFEHDGKPWSGVTALLPRDVETFQFYTDEYGVLKRFTQKAGAREVELDIRRFIHYVRAPEEDPYYGQSDLKAAYRPWFMKDIAIKFWSQHLERMAGGFGVLNVGASSIIPGSPDYAAMQNILANMRSNMGIIIPSGAEFELVHPTTTDAFQKAAEFHDLGIAKALLVPNLLGLSNTGSTGAYAQSQTQLEVFFVTLAANTQRLEQTLNDQLFRDVVRLNWEDGLAPRFKFKNVNSEQLKWMVETWSGLVGANIVVATEADEAHLRKLMDMPTREPDDEPLVTPQQVREQANMDMDRASANEDRAFEKEQATKEQAQKFSRLWFHAQHDQLSHGNWANGGVGDRVSPAHREEIAARTREIQAGLDAWIRKGETSVPASRVKDSRELAEQIKARGGFTYNPLTGEEPADGYALSILPGNEVVFKGLPDSRDVATYMAQHHEVFTGNPKAHIGAWVDAETGKTYLDVSVIESDRDTAVTLARQYGQEGIYDLKAGNTIIVKDAAERRYTSNGADRFPAGGNPGRDSADHSRDDGEAQKDIARELFHAEHDQKDHGNWSDGPSYGEGPSDSISIRAVHYSKEPRAELDSSKFGTGAAAREKARLSSATDMRLLDRINFYTSGTKPEATVGMHGHAVKIGGLYDTHNDPRDFIRIARANMHNPVDAGNTFETNVLNAGYTGYVSGDGKSAVLLGRRTVPVKYLGTRTREYFHQPGGKDHDQMNHGKRGGSGDPVRDEMDKITARVGAATEEKKTPGVDADHAVDINKIREQLAADKNFKSLTPENQQIVMDKYAASAAAHAEFVADLEAMAAAAEGGETSFPLPQYQFEGTGQLKGVTKAMAKVANDDGGDAKVLADILRGTVVVQDKAGAESVVATIREKYAITEDRSRNYMDPNFDPIDGYRDAKFVVRLKNGAVAEIQVNLPKMLAAKNGPGHVLYNEREKWLQNLGKSAKALTVDEAKVYAGYNKKMRDIYSPADVIRVDPSKVSGHFTTRARSASNSANEIGQPDLIATSTSKSRGGSTSQALQPGKSDRPSDTGIPSALKYGQSANAANLSAIPVSPPNNLSNESISQRGMASPSKKAAFTRASNRVDFAVIARRAANIEGEFSANIAKLTARAARRVADTERLSELLADPAMVADLKLDGTDVGKIKAAFRNMLERGWGTGLSQAMDETGKARKIAYTQDARKVRFASLRDSAAEFFDANAFRMAGNLTDAMRAIIQQELQQGLKFGRRPEEVALLIFERLVRKGMTTLEALADEAAVSATQMPALEQALLDILDQVNTPGYLNTLVRTNMFEAMNEARYAEFTDPAVADFVVALEYSAILDDRTTDICNALDGHIHMSNSAVWNTYRPPNHYNCRSLLIAVTKLDGWDGQESDIPTVEPQDGFK